MEQSVSNIIEIFIFFITLAVILQAVMSIDTSKIFKKNSTWEIQIFFIFGSIIFAYLFSKAIINLINLTVEIAGAI